MQRELSPEHLRNNSRILLCLAFLEGGVKSIAAFSALKKARFQYPSTTSFQRLCSLHHQTLISHLRPPPNPLQSHAVSQRMTAVATAAEGGDFPPASLEDVFPTVMALLPSPAKEQKCCPSPDTVLLRVPWTCLLSSLWDIILCLRVDKVKSPLVN